MRVTSIWVWWVYYNEHTRGSNHISRVCITLEEIWSAFWLCVWTFLVKSLNILKHLCLLKILVILYFDYSISDVLNSEKCFPGDWCNKPSRIPYCWPEGLGKWWNTPEATTTFPEHALLWKRFGAHFGFVSELSHSVVPPAQNSSQENSMAGVNFGGILYNNTRFVIIICDEGGGNTGKPVVSPFPCCGICMWSNAIPFYLWRGWLLYHNFYWTQLSYVQCM